MYNLISANLAKMRKSLCFKIYLAFALLYSILSIIFRFVEIERIVGSEYFDETLAELSFNADSIMFDSAMTMICAAVVFTGLFIGREYGDGTMRNKLIAGYKRSAVYLSNLISCIAANVTAMLIALGTALAAGIPLFGTKFTLPHIVLFIVFMIADNAAVTSVLLFVSMIISCRSAGIVTLVLSFIGLFFVSVYIEGRLNNPEYYFEYALKTDENGDYYPEAGEKMLNPYYISGTQRKIYEFLDENLPVSQLYHMASEGDTPDSPISLASDAAVLILFTGAGIMIFRKKNIR